MKQNRANKIMPEESLRLFKKKFDLVLKQYFKKQHKRYSKISTFIANFIDDLAEFSLRGGKRFRPALIYYSYKLFGGKNEVEILKLAVFIELMQSFLLIHDDIMDRANLRRGNATIHKIYEKLSANLEFNDDDHFGNTMGILMGDLATQFAFEVISDSNFPLENKNKLLNLVTKEISEVCFGQIHDILLNYNYPKNYTVEDILKVYYYKTATYTYKLPLLAGATMAGAKEKDLKTLEKYAINSGIAFQIRDDILGVLGEENETGKDTKTDIAEGKKTLLLTEAYVKANKKQKEILDKYVGKKDLSDDEAEIVREIFRSTGALEFVVEKCKKSIEDSKKYLKHFSDLDSESYNFLQEIADYMAIRNV